MSSELEALAEMPRSSGGAAVSSSPARGRLPVIRRLMETLRRPFSLRANQSERCPPIPHVPENTFLQPHELELAAYAFALAAHERHVGPADAQRLLKCNETLQQTRDAFAAYGRGNVRQDVERTGGESSRRTSAARKLTAKYTKRMPDYWSAAAFAPAMAAYAQAGNCGEHAGFATFTHGVKLREKESVRLVKHRTIDHAWSEESHGEEPELTITMDAWADGPAIYAKDGYFSGNAGEGESIYQFDWNTGASATWALNRVRNELVPDKRKELHRLIKQNKKDETRRRPADSSLWRTVSVLSAEFTEDLAEKMGSPADMGRLGESAPAVTEQGEDRKIDLRNEIRAVGVAQTIFRKSVRESTRGAPAIVEAARRLLKE